MSAMANAAGEPVLRVRELTKRFRKRTAVNGLSLTVERGDVYGFLGPNGAGKTTTLRMLAGLIRPSAGHVEIAGERLSFWHRAPLSRIGTSIESPAFYTYLSGRDNLRIFADLTGPCPPRRIDEVLERVGLTRRAGDKVRVYSHGMKQRLAIAAALLPKPEIVLLDEPTNGLDPMGIHDVRELIRSLARDDGYTIFLSSHLLVEVEEICNRGAILVEGNKVWEGRVADLLGTRRRVRLRARPVETACQLLGERGVAIRRPGDANGANGAEEAGEPAEADDLFYAESQDMEAEDMVALLVTAGCRVREVATEVPSLEEVFLELVQGKGET